MTRAGPAREMDTTLWMAMVLLVTLVTQVQCDTLQQVNLCQTQYATFNQRPNAGSFNYGGVISFTKVPNNDSNQGYRSVCECLLESTSSHFDLMFKLRDVRTNDECNKHTVCADRMEVDYLTIGGASELTVISQGDIVLQRTQQYVTSAKIRYIDEPDNYDLANTADLEIIATKVLHVTCSHRTEPNPDYSHVNEEPPINEPGDKRKKTGAVNGEQTEDSSGALIITIVVVSVVAGLIVCALIIFALYKKASSDKKQHTTYLSTHRPNNNTGDSRYVSLDTMQKSNAKIQIDDAEECVSFDTPRSKGATVSQSSPTVTIDLSASGGAGNSGYDYIDTVDYFQQAGSEPTSPETISHTSPNSLLQNTSADIEPGRNNGAELSPSSFTDRVQNSNEYENLERSDSVKSNTHKSTHSDSPNCVQTTNNSLSESTKANGYGQGAIPKRAKESYYQLWGDRQTPKL